jgi:methionyl-tRNA formyltransferase
VIYLFGNEGPYGRAVLAAARRCVRRAGSVAVVLARSEATEDRARDRLRHEQRRLERELGVPTVLLADVHQPAFLDRLTGRDHGIIAGFDTILSRPVVDHLSSLVNLHPSLLPYYRGPVPTYWCLAYAERRTGFTLHAVSDRIDHGPVLYQEVVEILPRDDLDALDRRIGERAARTLCRYLGHLQSGEPWPVVQVPAEQVYAHRVGYRSFPDADADASSAPDAR